MRASASTSAASSARSGHITNASHRLLCSSCRRLNATSLPLAAPPRQSSRRNALLSSQSALGLQPFRQGDAASRRTASGTTLHVYRGSGFGESTAGSSFEEPVYEPQVLDPVAATFKTAADVAATSAGFVVAGLSDMLATVAHPGASRLAIEASVKGGLVLLGLGLLQSVLSFVLSAGFVVLLLYAMTQVFGVRLPLLGSVIPPAAGARQQQQQGPQDMRSTPGGRQYRAPRPPYTGQQRYSGVPYGQQRYGGSGTAPGERYDNQGQGRQYRQYPPRQRPANRGDIVDVYFEPGS